MVSGEEAHPPFAHQNTKAVPASRKMGGANMHIPACTSSNWIPCTSVSLSSLVQSSPSTFAGPEAG